MTLPLFESVSAHPDCDFCTERVRPVRLDIDAVYCISLQEQPERAARATAHFHAIGLCRQVMFYRPQRSRNTERGVWESHRRVAQDAVERGYSRVLILEDDVEFRRPVAKWASRLEAAFRKLPAGWWGLYLGHLPFGGYLVRPGLMRVCSTLAHAYVANVPLLDWLIATKPMTVEVPMMDLTGVAIDSAMACLPEMYALFPMIATQKFLDDRRIDPKKGPDGKRRKLSDPSRWREWAIFAAPSIFQWFAAVLSPLQALTFETRLRYQIGKSRAAREIRAAGLFDDDFYLTQYPGVAEVDFDPLSHYIWHGAAEGLWPNPSFDPRFYWSIAGADSMKNPLVHYLRVGQQRGYPTILRR
jgi:glycosyl transferase, family 25